jgi:hypothetical protein
MGEMNRKVVEGAEKQHGLTTFAGAAEAVGRDAAFTELRSPRWERCAPVVYRLRGAPRTWEQRVMALVLAAGPDAAASHRSAAALLGIPGFGRYGVPEVTTRRDRRHRSALGVVHRCRAFPADHLTVVDHIVATRVARTLVDLAAVLHPGRLERAVDSCLGQRMVTLDSLASTFAELAARGRPGTAAMRAILATRGTGYVAPESELEARFLAFLAANGVPEPVRQLDVGGVEGWIGRVDYAYPAVQVLIELDGRAHHTAKLDRDADARRDAGLRAAGWGVVIRITWDDLVQRPDELLARLRRALLTPAA